MRTQDPGDRFAAIARELQHRDGQASTLDRIVELAVEVIDGCDHAGITRVENRRPSTVAATDDVARAGDHKQYELGEGPCLDALTTERAIHSPRLAAEQRWSRWTAWMNAEQGINSMLCVQLYTTGRSYGGLNLYSKSEDGFDDHDQAVALALAAHAAVAMAAVVESENLNIALHTRTAIGQAEGILMERFDLTADQAFAVLSRVSQHDNRRIGEVAQDLVTTRRTPGT